MGGAWRGRPALPVADGTAEAGRMGIGLCCCHWRGGLFPETRVGGRKGADDPRGRTRLAGRMGRGARAGWLPPGLWRGTGRVFRRASRFTAGRRGGQSRLCLQCPAGYGRGAGCRGDGVCCWPLRCFPIPSPFGRSGCWPPDGWPPPWADRPAWRAVGTDGAEERWPWFGLRCWAHRPGEPP